MAVKFCEDIAVFAKSIALIDKTRIRLEQIDDGVFPTDSSENGRQLLLNALNKLRDPKLLTATNPEVLYNRLIALQKLVDDIEGSSSYHISWPLVSFCDDIWTEFFGSTNPKILYSVTRKHNYSVYSFSSKLIELLQNILPKREINNIINDIEIYCLHLSSIEDTNLPLYANIAHEFGHPLYYVYKDKINDIWRQEFDELHKNILNDLENIDKAQSNRMIKRIIRITLAFAQELFADLFASLLMGPAFFLSLYEMGWGANRCEWPIILSPIYWEIKAYPSFNFRLKCIKNYSGVSDFEKEAVKEFNKLRNEPLKKMHAFCSDIPICDDLDKFIVYPQSDNDQITIQTILNKHLKNIMIICDKFLEQCYKVLKETYGTKIKYISAHDVYELLLRLENDILPNIVPDGSLLGTPAGFQTILNASSIYRLYILLGGESPGDTKNVSRDVQKVERLTEKALEVAYVQQRFKRKKP